MNARTGQHTPSYEKAHIMDTYRARLDYWIQRLLSPSIVCLVAAQFLSYPLQDVLRYLGYFVLGITAGLLLAIAMSFATSPERDSDALL
jgi:hypothetical protein